MALGIRYLGSLTVAVDGSGAPGSSEIELVVDVPAGSYIRVVWAVINNGYDSPTFTDDAGNDYSNVSAPGRCPNCLAVSIGQKIYVHHAHSGTPQPSDGLVFLGWFYAITGGGVAVAAGNLGTTTSSDSDGTLDGIVNLSTSQLMPEKRALLAIAEVNNLTNNPAEYALPPSITSAGWASGGGQRGDFFNSVFPATLQNSAMVVASRIASNGDSITWSAAHTYGSVAFLFGISWEAYYESQSSADAVANLETPFRHFVRVWTEEDALLSVRSDGVVPPFAGSVVTVDAGPAANPDLYLSDERQIGLLYEFDGNVVRRFSNDDGVTWEATEVAFTGGAYPRAARDAVTRTVVEFALVGGALKARRRTEPGGRFSAEFAPTGLGAIEEAAFGASWAYDDQRRLVLSINDGTQIVEYESTDDGDSFTAVP